MHVLLRPATAFAFVLCPATAATQATTIHLRSRGTTLAHEFERLSSARELESGVLVAVDQGEGAIFRIDFGSNTVQQIGRKGGGPQEYGELGRLNCASNDSSLIDDRQLGRWMLLKDDRIVSSEMIVDRFGYTPVLAGGDRFGRLLELRALKYGQSPGLPRLEYPAAAESLLVIIDYRRGLQRDTVARVRGAFRGLKRLLKSVAPSESPIPWIVQNPFAIEEQAVLFCDGWIAIVRSNPYSIEWIGYPERRSISAALPFVKVRVGEVQMIAATEAEHGRTIEPKELAPWPDFLPAFSKNALFPLQDGRLAIRRIGEAGTPGTRYDIVDRTGRVSARLELKSRESVLTFGKESVYVVSTDSDGVQTLTKYVWPAKP